MKKFARVTKLDRLVSGENVNVKQSVRKLDEIKRSLLEATPIDFRGLECIVADYNLCFDTDYVDVEIFCTKKAREKYLND